MVNTVSEQYGKLVDEAGEIEVTNTAMPQLNALYFVSEQLKKSKEQRFLFQPEKNKSPLSRQSDTMTQNFLIKMLHERSMS